MTPPAPELNFSNELRDTAPDDVIALWPDGAPGGELVDEITVPGGSVEHMNEEAGSQGFLRSRKNL